MVNWIQRMERVLRWASTPGLTPGNTYREAAS